MKWTVVFIAAILSVLPGVARPLSTTEYRNQAYGFRFVYPKNYEHTTVPKISASNYIESLSHLPTRAEPEELLALRVPIDRYAHTNLTDCFVVVRAATNLSESECMACCPEPPTDAESVERIAINGIKFVKGTVRQGGMSHQLIDVYYHTMHNGHCIEMTISLRTITPGVDPRRRKEVNSEALIQDLEKIMTTFAFIEDAIKK